jgi:hypothetical protein
VTGQGNFYKGGGSDRKPFIPVDVDSLSVDDRREEPSNQESIVKYRDDESGKLFGGPWLEFAQVIRMGGARMFGVARSPTLGPPSKSANRSHDFWNRRPGHNILTGCFGLVQAVARNLEPITGC